MECIAVLGGGIAGLAVALSEKRSGREIVIVERDPEPPRLNPDQAFEQWARPGVPQFRHAHMFLARLQTTLRDDHPDLLAELKEAGLELSTLAELLPESQLEHPTVLPGDEDLRHLWGRRPTFEYVMRRYVGRLPHVRFIHSARVEELRFEQSGNELRVCGVEYVRHGTRREHLEADLVVDASGRRTHAPEWLGRQGVRVEVLSRPSQREYVCRHYRLRDARRAPRRLGTGANYDYFGYATFYAEHGHFAITLSCPLEEHALVQAMRRPEGFEAICAGVPTLGEWIKQSVPVSKVLGAGQFENRWTHYGAPGGRELLGYFAVGDSQIITNPMYGRGCASAFVQAKVLSEVLAESSDPQLRAQRYGERTYRAIKPHFDFCVGTDRMFQSRGKLSRGQQIPVGDRVIKHLYEEAWTPAMHRSPRVAREMIKAMQMRELSSVPTRLYTLLVIMLTYLVTRVFRKGVPRVDTGPARGEFLQRLPAGREDIAAP